MNILVLGGTRFFGVPMVKKLAARGHTVTIATRGLTPDGFGDGVERIVLNRCDPDSLRKALGGRYFDAAIDKIAYCSNDIRYLLDVLECGQYLYMSTTAVYEPKHMNTTEADFDPARGAFRWENRADSDYAQVKRGAERALFQCYPQVVKAAVRMPVVLGRDDYTGRLKFYAENTVRGVPMHIDNADAPMSFIRSDEAGLFLAFLAEQDFTGAIHAASQGTVTIAEILAYVREKTSCAAILSPDGTPAPYNGEPAFSINTDRAAALGFRFSEVREWIFGLVDSYIAEVCNG
ncbi:MAG: reductase [Oscillospiraceae bacterium]